MPNTPQILDDPIAELADFVDVAMAENAGVFAPTKEKKPRPRAR
jgi:hypothetical protein